MKDREHDSIHDLNIDKSNHWSGAAPDLDKAALNAVASAQLPPQVPEEVEETEQFRQVFFQLPHDGRISFPSSAVSASANSRRKTFN